MEERKIVSGEAEPVNPERTHGEAVSGRIYPENFCTEGEHPKFETVTLVTDSDVLTAAWEHVKFGRTAVLHFSGTRVPGKTVSEVLSSQEFSLCAGTDLEERLRNSAASRDFYARYKNTEDTRKFQGVLCHRDVTVHNVRNPLPQKDWFHVDVISCPAPDVRDLAYTNQAVVGAMFAQRIRTILEIAVDNGDHVVILGAFGCGGCGNAPELVARVFREVLQESRYRNAFCRVVFAIQSTVNSDPYTVCPNIAAFETAFQGTSGELEKLRYVGGAQTDPGAEDVVLPGGRIRYRGSESREYQLWRCGNPYYGKQFSILGDSISTLEGFNPPGSAVFYQGDVKERTGVREMKDTWWGKVIDFFGGELLVNDSWSGCRVTQLENRKELYPSACSEQRTGNLHVGTVLPDVILVYLGFNDWGDGSLLLPVVEAPPELHMRFFVYAYSRMLEQLRRNYPGAEIWCATLNRTFVSANPRFRFPEAFGGIPIQEYNRAIEHCVLKAECRLLDLERQCVPYDAVDGTHPNRAGMDTLAALIVRQMADATGSAMLDCEREHEYVYGACRRCGKRTSPGANERSVLPKNQMPSDGNRDCGPQKEDPDAAEGLETVGHAQEQGDLPVLRLRIRETGEIYVLSGERITVGRSRECDLRLEDPYVARAQATFLHAGGQWYVRDNGSRNGTWLNGIRMANDRLCSVRIGDEISFAKRVTVSVEQ